MIILSMTNMQIKYTVMPNQPWLPWSGHLFLFLTESWEDYNTPDVIRMETKAN